MMKTQQSWITATVIATFAGVICFFNVDSAWADDNNMNTALKIAGVAFSALAGYCAWKSSTK